MAVGLGYGSGRIPLIDFPGDIDLIEPASRAEPVSSEWLRAKLTAPDHGAGLPELIGPGDEITIVVPDITRYDGADRYVPILIETVLSLGVRASAITILFANGTHRPMSSEEIGSIVTRAVQERIRAINHDARDQSQLASIGLSWRAVLTPIDEILGSRYVGAPSWGDFIDEEIQINRAALGSGSRKTIITGATRAHYLAGFGSARKSIVPGLASLASATAFHYLAIDPIEPAIAAGVEAGRLDGNPLHLAASAIARHVAPIFSLSLLLDHRNEIVGGYSGDLEKSFDSAVERERSISFAPIKAPYDLIVASAGGAPKDINLIQAHKAIRNATAGLKEGGALYFAARAPDQIGSEPMLQMARSGRSAKEIMLGMKERFQINDQTIHSIRRLAERYRIHLFSELDPDIVRSIGFIPIESASVFLRRAREHCDRVERAAIFPRADSISPTIIESGRWR